MLTLDSDDFQDKSHELLQLTTDTESVKANQPIQTRIRIRIPKKYNDEPVISRLISHYGVTVNIAAALLGANARDDGWFDLELRGTDLQIQNALNYLNEMDLEIWDESNTEEYAW
jgi:ABC-type methionine transport system ATPase subunit